jgi:hypothetical protein
VGMIMSPKTKIRNMLFSLITRVAFNMGVEAVPQQPWYNEGLL